MYTVAADADDAAPAGLRLLYRMEIVTVDVHEAMLAGISVWKP